MVRELEILNALAHELQERLGLEELLQRVVERGAELLRTPRVSLRVIEPGATTLLALCRAGEPLHTDAKYGFKLGEGLVGWIAEHATSIRIPDAEHDPRFVARGDMKEPMGSFVGVPLVSGKAVIGVLSAVHSERDHFTPEHEALLRLLAGISAPQIEVARLSRLARVDHLTGTFNRHGLDRAFPDASAARAGEPQKALSIAMVDIDHFKAVNDQHGHAVGDEVLRQVAGLLGTVLRADDSVIRYGGEEFLVVLPNVELVAALRIAERARQAVEATEIVAGPRTTIRVTISIGVAQQRDGEERPALIERADLAMYAAKRAGRNRVEPSTGS